MIQNTLGHLGKHNTRVHFEVGLTTGGKMTAEMKWPEMKQRGVHSNKTEHRARRSGTYGVSCGVIPLFEKMAKQVQPGCSISG